MNHARELKKLDAVFSDIVPPVDTRDWEKNKYESTTKQGFDMFGKKVDVDSSAKGPLVFQLDGGGKIELEASCIDIDGQKRWCRIKKASTTFLERAEAEAESGKYPPEITKRIQKYKTEAAYDRNNSSYWYFMLDKDQFPSEVYENDFDITATPVETATKGVATAVEDKTVADDDDYYTEPIFGSRRYYQTYEQVEETIKLTMDQYIPPFPEGSGELPPLQKRINYHDFMTKLLGDSTAFVKTATQTCAFIEAEPGDGKSPSVPNLLENQYNDDICTKYELPKEYFQDPKKYDKLKSKSFASVEKNKEIFRSVFLHSVVAYTDIMYVFKERYFDDRKQTFMGQYCTKTQYDQLKEIFEFVIQHLLDISKQCIDEFEMESPFESSGPRRARTPVRPRVQWNDLDVQAYYLSLRGTIDDIWENIELGTVSDHDILKFNQLQNAPSFINERDLFNSMDDMVQQDPEGIAQLRERLRVIKEKTHVDPNWPNGTGQTYVKGATAQSKEEASFSVKRMGKILSTIAFSVIGSWTSMYALNAVVPDNIEDIFRDPVAPTMSTAIATVDDKTPAPTYSDRSILVGNIASSVIIKQMTWCTSSFIAKKTNIETWCIDNPLNELDQLSRWRRNPYNDLEGTILDKYKNKPRSHVINELMDEFALKIPNIAAKCVDDKQQELKNLRYNKRAERGKYFKMTESIEECVRNDKEQALKDLTGSQHSRPDGTRQDELALKYLSAYVYENYLAEHRAQVLMVTEFQWWLMALFVGQQLTHVNLFSYWQKKISSCRKQLGVMGPLVFPTLHAGVLFAKGYTSSLGATHSMWQTYNTIYFSSMFLGLHGGNQLIHAIIGEDEKVDVSNGQVYKYNDGYSYYTHGQCRYIQQIADTRFDKDPQYIDIAFDKLYAIHGKFDLNRVEYIHMPPGTFIKYFPGKDDPYPFARLMVIVNSCGAMDSGGSSTIYSDFFGDQDLPPGDTFKRIAFCPFTNTYHEIDCNNYGYVESIKRRILDASKHYWNALYNGTTLSLTDAIGDLREGLKQSAKVQGDIINYPLHKRNFRIPAIIDLLQEEDFAPFIKSDFLRSTGEDRRHKNFLIPLQANRIEERDNTITYTGSLWSPIKGTVLIFDGEREVDLSHGNSLGPYVQSTFQIRREEKRFVLILSGDTLFHYEHPITEHSEIGNLHFVKV